MTTNFKFTIPTMQGGLPFLSYNAEFFARKGKELEASKHDEITHKINE